MTDSSTIEIDDAPDELPEPRPPGVPRPRREEALFPPAGAAPFTWLRVGLGAGAVVAGTLLSLGRVRHPGAFDSLFAEDGAVFLHDAWNRPFGDALLRPYNGYVHVGPRLLAEVAALAPVRWSPAVLTVQAALVTALLGLCVYAGSAAHLRHPLARLVVAVPAVALPWSPGFYGGESGPVDNNVATLQFPALYATFWMLLWTPPRLAGRIAAALVVAATAASSLLAVVFVPLAAYRFAVRRDRHSALLAGLLAAGAAVQAAALVLGPGRDVSRARFDPAWVLTEYVTTLVPRAVLGDRWLDPPSAHRLEHLALVALAWLVPAGVAWFAVRRLTAPAFRLAAVAAAHSFVLFGGQVAAHGSVPARYVVAPALLLLAALVALVRPGPAAPLAALAVLVAVACVANLRADTYRTKATPWHERVAQAQARCAADPALRAYRTIDMPAFAWATDIPCQLVR